MIFIEQPGGTGFSTASSAWTGKEAEKRTEDDVAESMYAFFQNLYSIFGQELAEKKIYVTGESYAGMYIPAIARGFYLGNKKLETTTSSSSSLHFIDIRGVAIGNGWIDVDTQGAFPAVIFIRFIFIRFIFVNSLIDTNFIAFLIRGVISKVLLRLTLLGGII
jgi:carboxypeptidase C (cathepsin A)